MYTTIVIIIRGIRSARFVLPLLLLCLSIAQESIAQNFWQPTTGPNAADLRALAINSSGQIFAASYGGGIFRSTNNGDSWTVVNSGLTNTNVRALAINSTSGYIFAGTGGGRIFRSMDNGASWTAKNSGVSNFNISALAINSSGHIFAGTDGGGIFRSMDNGENWTAVNSGLEGFRMPRVVALAINFSGHIFAGINDGGVYRSTTNGASWTNVTGNVSLNAVALAINSSGHIFAANDGGGVNGVYRSTNNGNSWTAVSSDLPRTSFGAALVLVINSSGHIFWGGGAIFHSTTSGSGIYRSTTNGESWTAVNSGLTDFDVGALAINSSGHIFAGTYGGVVFRSVQSTAPNRLPVVADTIPNQTLTIGGPSFTRDLNASPVVFTDPDGDALTYTASSSATNIATASISGGTLTVAPIAAGSATITVTANDGSGGTALTTFTVTVGNVSNRPPVVANAISNQTLTTGGASFTRNLNAPPAVFNDPDGDALTYTTSSSATGVATASISGSTLTVAPVAAGNATIAITANDGRGGTVSTNFTVTVVTAVNRPPVVANVISNQTLTIGGALFRRDLNLSPPVFTDPDGDMLTYTVNSSAMNIATASISGSMLTVAPVAVGSATITVTANDGRGGMISTPFTATANLPAYPSSLNLNTTVAYPSRPKASDYPATEYRIVGLPGASNRSVNEFLSGAQNQNWQVYWDNGAASNFFVVFNGSANFQFSVGRAFWVINKGTANISTTSPSAPLNNVQEIELPLPNSGWNLITNPFTTSVAWSKIQSANNVTEPICKFTGSFSTATSFDPYSGYYFFNATNLTKLKIPYSLYFSSTPEANADPAIWRVNISFSSGEISDQSTSFGIASEASPGLDQFDFRKPRAIAATPTVEFKRPTWDAKYSTFATDIRPEFEDAESWEFDVRAISRQPAQLTFSGISKIPSRFEVYLIDADHAQSVNLREDSLYHFTPAAELMKFKVVVGRKEKVQEQLSSLMLPKDFALGPNYPNPFNPTTTIPVAVPVAAEIKLKIYNLLGAEVKTLYEGTIEAGRYWFNWDGRNELGNQVATGVYLYRLTKSKGLSLLGKMILLR